MLLEWRVAFRPPFGALCLEIGLFSFRCFVICLLVAQLGVYRVGGSSVYLSVSVNASIRTCILARVFTCSFTYQASGHHSLCSRTDLFVLKASIRSWVRYVVNIVSDSSHPASDSSM